MVFKNQNIFIIWFVYIFPVRRYGYVKFIEHLKVRTTVGKCLSEVVDKNLIN